MTMAADATKEIQFEIQCLIRSGMIHASKNCARKSSRLPRRSSVSAKVGKDTNYTNPHEFAKGGKRFSSTHETRELTRIKKSDSREVSCDIEH